MHCSNCSAQPVLTQYKLAAESNCKSDTETSQAIDMAAHELVTIVVPAAGTNRIYRKRAIDRAQALGMNADAISIAAMLSDPVIDKPPAASGRSSARAAAKSSRRDPRSGKRGGAGSAEAVVTLDLPADAVKYVIGAKGATIKALEAESGASLRVVGRQGGTRPQQVIIKGTTESVSSAHDSVLAILGRHSEPTDADDAGGASSSASGSR